MWLAGLFLAGVGVIPVPEAVKRFPDSSFYPGSGVQRDANLLQAIVTEAGEALLTRGPGPGQIMERFRRGELPAEERVAVLLAACHFHDPKLLPLYRWAFQQGNFREKLAALVGFYQLVGLDPPAPSQVPKEGGHWQELALRVEALFQESRATPLVRLWVRTYLAASGISGASGFVFRVNPEECLRAIGRLAQPEDLADVITLWPLVSDRHRSWVVRLLENLLLYRWVPPLPNPEGPSGPWIMETAVASVDAWVGKLCGTPDGWQTFWERAKQLGNGDAKEGLLLVLRQPYPPVWPQAARHLQFFGAPAVVLDPSQPLYPANEEKVKQLRAWFQAGREEPEKARTPPFPLVKPASPGSPPAMPPSPGRPPLPVPPRPFPGG
ncbi:MAG: hypothetical protein ACUVRE_03125 [Thermoanaerobaculaceae bacterium]